MNFACTRVYILCFILYVYTFIETHPLSPSFSTFSCADQLCECFSAVSEWQELEAWYTHVNSLQGQANDSSSAFSIHYDINQLRYVYMVTVVCEYDSMTVLQYG